MHRDVKFGTGDTSSTHALENFVFSPGHAADLYDTHVKFLEDGLP